MGLFPLRIYTPSNCLHVLPPFAKGLFPLRIYTALKRSISVSPPFFGLLPYEFTLLKPFLSIKRNENVCFPYEFTLLSNQLSMMY